MQPLGAAVQRASQARTLVICADDFGLHAGVNAAVLELAALGRLSATSAMVGAPAWPQGAVTLRSQAAHWPLEVGLHLDLTEFPLQMQRRSLPSLLAATYGGSLDVALLETEILAQWQAFEQHMQAAPHYLDGHQHVHQFPQVREALVRVLQRKLNGGLAQARPGFWVRNTAARGQTLKAKLIASLGQTALSRQLQALPIKQSAGLLGVYGFDATPAQYSAHLATWLSRAQAGQVLMCHPSKVLQSELHSAAAQTAPDPIETARCVEWQVLSSDRFAQLLQRLGLRVGPMSDCVEQE